MPADPRNESSDENNADRAWAVAALYGAIKHMAPDLLLTALRVVLASATWIIAAIGVAVSGPWWILTAGVCLLGRGSYLAYRMYRARRLLRRLPPIERDAVLAANRQALKVRLTSRSAKVRASMWSVAWAVPLAVAAYALLARWWAPAPAAVAVALLAIWRTAVLWLPLPRRAAQVSSLFEDRRGPDGLPTPEI